MYINFANKQINIVCHKKKCDCVAKKKVYLLFKKRTRWMCNNNNKKRENSYIERV